MPRANVSITADTSQAIAAIGKLRTTWQEAAAKLTIFREGFSLAGEALSKFVDLGPRVDRPNSALAALGPTGKAFVDTLSAELGGVVDKVTLAQQSVKLFRAELGLSAQDVADMYKWALAKAKATGLSYEEIIEGIVDTVQTGSKTMLEQLGYSIEQTLDETNAAATVMRIVHSELSMFGDEFAGKTKTMEESLTALKNQVLDAVTSFRGMRTVLNGVKGGITALAGYIDAEFTAGLGDLAKEIGAAAGVFDRQLTQAVDRLLAEMERGNTAVIPAFNQHLDRLGEKARQTASQIEYIGDSLLKALPDATARRILEMRDNYDALRAELGKVNDELRAARDKQAKYITMMGEAGVVVTQANNELEARLKVLEATKATLEVEMQRDRALQLLREEQSVLKALHIDQEAVLQNTVAYYQQMTDWSRRRLDLERANAQAQMDMLRLDLEGYEALLAAISLRRNELEEKRLALEKQGKTQSQAYLEVLQRINEQVAQQNEIRRQMAGEVKRQYELEQRLHLLSGSDVERQAAILQLQERQFEAIRKRTPHLLQQTKLFVGLVNNEKQGLFIDSQSLVVKAKAVKLLERWKKHLQAQLALTQAGSKEHARIVALIATADKLMGHMSATWQDYARAAAATIKAMMADPLKALNYEALYRKNLEAIKKSKIADVQAQEVAKFAEQVLLKS